jgi:hypothetical protein
VQLRQRAPSRGGATPIEKVWRRLRVAKFGNSYPVPRNPRGGVLIRDLRPPEAGGRPRGVLAQLSPDP